jgi:molybdopterin converting factor small subunit
MATVHIPACLRGLTGGVTEVALDCTRVADLVDRLDERFPGMRERLVDDDHLVPDLSIVIDGVDARARLGTKVPSGAEVYVVSAVAGGER